MEILHTVDLMKSFSQKEREKGKRIGFVPTMGALHTGHLKLVEQAINENELVVCSIFVNPIQFNNPEDLKKYPRTLEQDLEKLETTGCHVVFYPSTTEMYPTPETKVYDFGLIDKVMEGRFRPGHFNGVAIVVKKLFDIVSPHKAYFGEKDYQQLAIIRELVKQENISTQIVACSTVREVDGLAMSSRNMRLSASQRLQAPQIFQLLQQASQLYPKKSIVEIKQLVEQTINNNPQMQLEYFELSDAETLNPVTESNYIKPIVACIAVYMGSIRLIDNIVFNK
jgi:pantoate--beta-alanine ligase